METLDCVIVGGGPAGIGVGIVLKDLGVANFRILERRQIGASFLAWPKEMQMITPSFPSNAYGLLDLNAIALQTSPAYSLETEHPSGEEYAEYLQRVAEFKELPLQEGIDVKHIKPVKDGFEMETTHGKLMSRHVIWAAGEFQYPRLDGFPGAEFGLHSSLIANWEQLEGDEFVVIGGYESGADAAIHLARLGKKVTIIDRNSRWTANGSSDPSVELSPFTKDRLRDIEDGLIELVAPYDVHWVERSDRGGYLIYCEDDFGNDKYIHTPNRPILATGFRGSLQVIDDLFEKGEQDEVILSDRDESTKYPGLFVVGPSVSHGSLLFCFIYKFRQRFAVVAETIARRLSLDVSALDAYRKQGMLLEDLACCGEDCEC